MLFSQLFFSPYANCNIFLVIDNQLGEQKNVFCVFYAREKKFKSKSRQFIELYCTFADDDDEVALYAIIHPIMVAFP